MAPGQLFQEFNISNASDPKALMRSAVWAFTNGAKAVDLVLTDPRCKHLILYTVALVPEQFRASAQLLVRRRDRRLRVRLLQHFRPENDEHPEVMRASALTNETKLGNAIKSKFVDVAGNNLNRTVVIQLAGKESAAKALIAIENAARFAYRELTFMSRYVEASPGTAVDGAEPKEAEGRQVSLMVTVTAS